MADRTDAAITHSDRLSAEIEATTIRWAGTIRAAAARFGLDAGEVDDLAQRVRVRIWQALERGQQGTRLGAGYGYRAALSAAIDIIREQRTRWADRHVSFDDEGAGLPAAPSGPADEATLLAHLDEVVQRLGRDQRVAVRLHLAGRHLREIARTTGWSDGRSRNVLYAGLAELRRLLQESP